MFWIPLHGWFSYKFKMIPVDRDKDRQHFTACWSKQTRAAASREIVTSRRHAQSPGGRADYKTGVFLLYEPSMFLACRSALNSGLSGRGKAQALPGTIIVEFLEPIPPGLLKRGSPRLQETIETASNRLIAEACG